MYDSVTLYFYAKVLVILGLAFLIALHMSPRALAAVYRRGGRAMPWLAAVLALALAYVAAHKKTYLPFLGEAVFPGQLLRPIAITPSSPEEKLIEFNVAAPSPDALHVVWWSAEVGPSAKPADQTSPREAYAEFTNAGIAPVVDGEARISMRCPKQYSVGRVLDKHVHYRVVYKNGLMGEVVTEKVAC